MKHICIVSQYFLPDINGDVIRLLNTLKVLLRKDCKITIITAFPHYPQGNVPRKYRWKLFVKHRLGKLTIIRTFIFPLPHSGFITRFLLYSSFMFSASLYLLLSRERYDVVWAFSQKFFSFIAGIACKLFKGCKLIMDFTDIWPYAIVNAGYMRENSLLFKATKLALKIMFTIADKVTTLTPAMQKLITTLGIPLSKTAIVPNVTKPVHVKPSKKLHLEKIVIMYSGNIGPNYDFWTLIKAAAIVKKTNEKVHFIIRGTGELEPTLRRIVKELDLSNVTIDTKLLPRKQLFEYLAGTDYFILPMKKHKYPDASLPIKLLDYLAIGKPIICLAEGYLAWLISREEIGHVIPPQDYAKLAKLLSNIKKPPKSIVRTAHGVIGKYFSFQKLEDSIVEIFGL